MNEQPVIMVQINDPQWTWEVLHSACALARACDGRVSLVKMVRGRHDTYPSAKLGLLQLDEQDRHMLQAYADTVTDYGVACDIKFYPCCDLFGAIAGAADQVGAETVFAKLPHSMIPFWADARFEVLRQHLSHQRLALYNKPVEVRQ